MDDRLFRLITDYQEKVMQAAVLMRRSGIYMPVSSFAWIEAGIPFSGKLESGAEYYKHGAGCLVVFNSGEVDFDFGEQGEIGGFNSWWLSQFAKDHLSKYGFDDFIEVDKCIKQELKTESLILLSDGLCYVKNVPRVYAVELDCRTPGDMLPERNQDRILVLQSHYFQTAELMLENYQKIKTKLAKGKYLSQREYVDQRIYLVTWLGFLGVTCEGFRKLNMRILLTTERPDKFKELISISDNIGRLMKLHADSLREFRNNIFHLREGPEIIRGFFDGNVDRILWARELHGALADFFSKYCLLSEVHYLLQGRLGESEFRRHRLRRKKI